MTKRHTDTQPGWIRRELAGIKRQIRELSAAKQLVAATIGKGGLSIRSDGHVTGYYPSGRPAFQFGMLDVGSPGFQVFMDQDSDGITTNALAEIYELPDGSKVTRFFGADFFTANGSQGLGLVGGTSSITVTGPGGGVLINGGSDGTKIVHSTTGASANCFIDPSDSRIWRSTSSRRYKQDVEKATVDSAAVLEMQGRTWRDKAEVEADPGTDRRYVGFIAEELHDLGLGQFVVYDDNNEPEAIAYDRLSVALLEVVKSLDTRIKKLEES